MLTEDNMDDKVWEDEPFKSIKSSLKSKLKDSKNLEIFDIEDPLKEQRL